MTPIEYPLSTQENTASPESAQEVKRAFAEADGWLILELEICKEKRITKNLLNAYSTHTISSYKDADTNGVQKLRNIYEKYFPKEKPSQYFFRNLLLRKYSKEEKDFLFDTSKSECLNEITAEVQQIESDIEALKKIILTEADGVAIDTQKYLLGLHDHFLRLFSFLFQESLDDICNDPEKNESLMNSIKSIIKDYEDVSATIEEVK